MRPEDLIPCFLDELGVLAKANENKEDLAFVEEVIERREEMCKNDEFSYEEYYDSESASYDLEELFDRLEGYALPYFYFGSHPGDGADYGFWLCENFQYDFEGKQVSDLSEIAEEDYGQEILHVNDHGNITLYSCDDKGKLTEIWALV
jgi:YD repeat-containing protein